MADSDWRRPAEMPPGWREVHGIPLGDSRVFNHPANRLWVSYDEDEDRWGWSVEGVEDLWHRVEAGSYIAAMEAADDAMVALGRR